MVLKYENLPRSVRPGIISFLAIEAEKRNLSINPYDAAAGVMGNVFAFDKPCPEDPMGACLDAARDLLDKMEARNGNAA